MRRSDGTKTRTVEEGWKHTGSSISIPDDTDDLRTLVIAFFRQHTCSATEVATNLTHYGIRETTAEEVGEVIEALKKEKAIVKWRFDFLGGVDPLRGDKYGPESFSSAFAEGRI